MKKSLLILFSALFVFAMAGCTKLPAGPADSSVLLNQAHGAEKALHSYTVTTTTTMDVTGKNKKGTTKATTVMHVQKAPFVAHMTRNLKTASGQTQMMDAYITKNAVYVKGPKNPNKWMKMNNGPTGNLQVIFESGSGDLKKELNKVDEFTNSLALTQDSKNYLASYTGKGKEFYSFAYNIAESQLPASTELKQYINNVKENNIYYYYSFNKEKYFPNQMELQMSMQVGDPQNPSDTLAVDFHTVGNFSDFNKVKVTIPSNVKSGAMSMSNSMK